MCNVAADLMLPGDGLREDGVVKSFNKSKGYGFIRIQSRTDDVYFKTEDLTPRSREVVEAAPRMNGAAISCAPEAFGESRVRARSVRLGHEPAGVKQPNSRLAGTHDVIKGATEEPSLCVAPSKTTAGLGSVRPWSKKAAATSRPRGWGVPSAEEVHRRKAQLMAMGFSEEAAHDALASGVDFNQVLDTLLSGGTLPTTRLSSDELESLPTTREGSDDASEDRSSSCGTGDKSPEAEDKRPEANVEELDEDLKAPTAVETNWEALLGACEPCPSQEEDVANVKVIEAVSEASDAVVAAAQRPSLEDSESAPAEGPARQLARVQSTWPEDSSTESQLSVQRGSLIYTWAGSATEHGWIYAERIGKSCLAGWIPTNVLTPLPLSYQWRRVTKSCPSFSDLHLAGEQGDIILVDGESTEQGAEEGWVYSEHLDGARVGWFPTCALDQLPAKLQWVHALHSLEAQHETQTTVEAGSMVLVDPETRTDEGWVYAWAADKRHGDSAKQSAKAGWVPANCLEWLHN